MRWETVHVLISHWYIQDFVVLGIYVYELGNIASKAHAKLRTCLLTRNYLQLITACEELPKNYEVLLKKIMGETHTSLFGPASSHETAFVITWA